MSSTSVHTFLPAGNCLATNCPAYIISARTAQKTSFLWCCIGTVVQLIVSRSLHSNGSTSHGIKDDEICGNVELMGDEIHIKFCTGHLT
jgi:hypothetical protein